MRTRNFLLIVTASLAVILFQTGSNFLRGQTPTPAALTGQVSSKEEGPMEGVVVSAKRAGSTVAITVVSDAKGRYSFPRAKLEPGCYSLRIRASGYELDSPGVVEIAAQKAAQLDLKLRVTKQ